MNKKLLFATSILAMCTAIFSCAKNQTITFEHDLDSDTKSFLEKQNIEYKNRKLKINPAQISESEKSSIEILLQYYTQKIDAEIENLSNADNANFENSGHQYFRKTISLSKDGKISITEDSENFRLEYDPQNSNAKTDGEFKGYVTYPNVDMESEAEELLESISIQKILKTAVRN